MNKLKFIAVVIICCFYSIVYCQQTNIWCFGDSSGIDFSNLNNPISINTSLDTRGTSVSIADSNGGLLIYAQTRATNGIFSTQVFNKYNQLLQNGDSIVGEGWYHELLLIPMPQNDSLLYLFSINVSGISQYNGLYYSLINVNTDSVLQKNIQIQNFPMVDCLTAVKHGNGRDWWLVFRRWYQPFTATNEFFTYLISPSGITNFNSQSIGSTHFANQGELTFSPSGEKLINADGVDLIELFDFDRCTGLLSNPITIHPYGGPLNYDLTWSTAFSASGNILYVSTSKDTSYLYQLDLTAANIYSSRIDLDTFYRPPASPGALKLGPDGKIYFTCAYDNGINFNYPYADTMYNYVNMNLSVINYPDSLGLACGYAPFSFYLGGKRTYYGLPNNPDYELGSLAGSLCDSLTVLDEIIIEPNKFTIFPNPIYNKTNIIGSDEIKSVAVINVSGKILFYIDINKQKMKSYYLDLQKYMPGVYFIKIQCESYIETIKIIKLLDFR